MKILLTCLCMLTVSSYSQDTASLHSTYLPLHLYQQSVTQNFHLVLSYTGNDSVMNVLKQKDVVNPTIVDKGTHITSVLTTGAYSLRKVMPVELTFTSAEDKDGKVIIPKNTRMLGTAANNAMPVYDSVISADMDSSAKILFLQSFKNILSQIFLPDRRMATGDTFIVTSPVSFPAGFVTIKMMFSTTYKLLNVKNNVAHFNIAIKYVLNKGVNDIAAAGGGSGSGVMDVDLINNYPLKYTSDYVIDISAEKGAGGVHILLSGSSDNENVVTKKM